MKSIVFDKLMLPDESTDLSKWAVVACDQYTSDREYWKRVADFVSDKPSTLNLICPEAHLDDVDKRLPDIKKFSEQYAKTLRTFSGGVLVKRTLKSRVRYGLVCKIDLEQYSYDGSKTAVRATEGTVIERIPPRLKVRKASVLDTPHVMCLIDDSKQTVIEPLIAQTENLTKLYDVQLCENGGRLEGYHISDVTAVEKALSSLENKAESDGMPFVLVGDGNHSLASAKALYEDYKASGDIRAGVARYALVELVNLHSDGIDFQPIHRVVFNAPDLSKILKDELKGDAKCVMLTDSGEEILSVPSDEATVYAEVQRIIDDYLKVRTNAKVDYIHGEDSLRSLCKRTGTVGVIMPALPKTGFFGFVQKRGILPRKSFSMGEAYEKRYYMEVYIIDGK